MKTENKALNYLLNLDLFVTGIALAFLIAVTFMGVITRYFFSSPFMWLEEVQLWCFVWITFFGGGAAFRTGSHVAIDVLVDMFPTNLKKIIEVFIYVVVLGVLIYFTIHGSNLVGQLLRTGRTTNILNIPYPVIYAAFPIGCVLMMINFTIMTAQSLFLKNAEVKGGE
ncbi:TRAP-type C4-dicarboxylate transport system permease small subunit [Anaerosolibacter carboniphilus]|uniref:TRAP-type C4-dicarboxylate transport system permease small subunit n=1 Tax=Anaerosolibacter carboniphilus TaxID=1417629 RepID=A0A841L1M3_9FIRM|nr:TRAP transporter small permease [Anaerosolibacter carboniphilus]MBB6218518.1 TRAP-type C4-dicarboxylate transport system permease small subunit [Anaerosolibacter carboniphilus]